MLTIGEKIRYFRQKRGITQSQLAQLADIHPVSIRKYETNKMQPQSAQTERIAAALWVNPSALDSTCGSTIRMKTRGDLLSVMMTWHKSGLLLVEGKRDETSLIPADSAQIKLHPVLSTYFQLSNGSQKDQQAIQLKNCTLNVVDDDILSLFLQWEKNVYALKMLQEKYSADERPIVQEKLQEMSVTLELVELELQANTRPLFMDEY